MDLLFNRDVIIKEDKMPEVLETKTCIVAFLDLLGTREAIKNDQYDANLYSMNLILQTAFDMCGDKHICKADSL